MDTDSEVSSQYGIDDEDLPAYIKDALLDACYHIEEDLMPPMDEIRDLVAKETVKEQVVELPAPHVMEDHVELIVKVPALHVMKESVVDVLMLASCKTSVK